MESVPEFCQNFKMIAKTNDLSQLLLWIIIYQVQLYYETRKTDTFSKKTVQDISSKVSNTLRNLWIVFFWIEWWFIFISVITVLFLMIYQSSRELILNNTIDILRKVKKYWSPPLWVLVSIRPRKNFRMCDNQTGLSSLMYVLM